MEHVDGAARERAVVDESDEVLADAQLESVGGLVLGQGHVVVAHPARLPRGDVGDGRPGQPDEVAGGELDVQPPPSSGHEDGVV